MKSARNKNTERGSIKIPYFLQMALSVWRPLNIHEGVIYPPLPFFLLIFTDVTFDDGNEKEEATPEWEPAVAVTLSFDRHYPLAA